MLCSSVFKDGSEGAPPGAVPVAFNPGQLPGPWDAVSQAWAVLYLAPPWFPPRAV